MLCSAATQASAGISPAPAAAEGQVESPTMPDPASARPRRPLLALLGHTLEGVLQRILALDPDSAARVAALEGRAVVATLGDALPSLRVRVEQGRLRVGPADGGDRALRVALAPASLARLALARRRGEPLPPGSVRIEGDAELARRLEQLASRFEPDIEEAFARAFGDVAGVPTARALRGAFAGARRSAGALARDAAEWLTEEGRDLVARGEHEQFLDDVDVLRERVDRLAARVNRLASMPRPPAR